MKLNKKETTTKILTMGKTIPCTKLELNNIVFPKWSDIGLMGMMFRQYLRTKEQPDGMLYNEATFQTVLRIIGGKVLMSGRPDCYCWKMEKLAKAKDVHAIGTNSAEGLINLCEVLATISDENEKKMLADFFANMKKDMLLAKTPAESRLCIEVTEELYANGLTHCVDEWMDEDEVGNADATELNVGDFLIVTDSGVYCIRREEFLETHSIS